MPRKSLTRHIRHKHPDVHLVLTSNPRGNDAHSLSCSEEIVLAENTELDVLMGEIQEEPEERVDIDSDTSWPASTQEVLQYQLFENAGFSMTYVNS
jgi:hypothetical protein